LGLGLGLGVGVGVGVRLGSCSAAPPSCPPLPPKTASCSCARRAAQWLKRGGGGAPVTMSYAVEAVAT
jgi:hypothetical protein